MLFVEGGSRFDIPHLQSDEVRPADGDSHEYSLVRLELLDQRPGLSNAELARGTFVTRQSMNVVLRGLQDAGLITRPATTDRGRALPAHLTEEGHRRLAAARSAVYAIDQRMTDAVPGQRLADLLADLDRMVAALDG